MCNDRYDRFQGCRHILDSLYDFASEHRLSTDIVDAMADEGFHDHAREYMRLQKMYHDHDEYETRLHQLHVHVLEGHVRKNLESYLLVLEEFGRPDLECDVENDIGFDEGD